MINITDAGKRWLETGERLERDYWKMMTQLANGIRPPTILPDCLKDEKRPLKKIYDVKTRTFQISSACYTMVIRTFCGDWINAFQRNCLNGYSAIGMDCESFQWEKMLQQMEKIGKKGFDGDFGSFDGTLDANCIHACFKLIGNWMKHHIDGIEVRVGLTIMKFTTSEVMNILMILADEMIHTNLLAMNCLYQKHQGNPSGNPLTVIINTMVNRMYFECAYMQIVPKELMFKFKEFVRLMAYGDDNIATVSSLVTEYFNFYSVQACFAEWGLTYTPADKQHDGETFVLKDVNELRFLKRTTQFNEDFGLRVPIMEPDTINEMRNYVRATNYEEACLQLMDNIENAARYKSLEGQVRYNEFVRETNNALHRVRLQPYTVPFIVHLEYFTERFQ